MRKRADAYAIPAAPSNNLKIKTTLSASDSSVYSRCRMFELYFAENPDQSEIVVEIDLHGYTVIYPFSYCKTDGRECSIECYLTKKTGVVCPGCDVVEFYEFGFKFSVSSDWGLPPSFETMDRIAASSFIPDGTRGLVLEIIQACLLALLQEVRPSYLYQVCFTPNVPETAHRKHELINFAAQTAGYRVVDEGTDSCGRRFWFMDMQPDSLTASGQK